MQTLVRQIELISFNVFVVDSSPKTSATKNVHLLSKETMHDTVNMLSTPTRRNRFMLGNNHATMMNDDSPVLSQESINIAWKWKNEGTPIRPTNKSSKLRRSISNNSAHLQNLQRLTIKRKSTENQMASTKMSPKLIADPETHSPKGLYKFQEEMRKIQFDIESDTLCDNINDKSMTEADTGYPTNLEGTAQAYVETNARCSSDNIDVQMMEYTESPSKIHSQNVNHGINDALADDLLNDSDFDQILLTCQMPAQKEATYETEASTQMSVKKASSAPEIKANDGSNSSGSNWNINDDDCFDDLVKDFDVDISSDSSAKFTRHKSMPQQPQKPSTSNTKIFLPQKTTSVYNNSINRKSFTRHESMPITNRPPNANNNISMRKNSGKWRMSLTIS